MNILDSFRYEIWLPVRVKLIYWYWIIKYGGEKRIPPGVIFEQMAKSTQRMTENLEKAMQISHDQMGHHETMQGLKLLQKSRKLHDRIEQLRQ